MNVGIQKDANGGRQLGDCRKERRFRWERIRSEDSRRKHEAPSLPPPRGSWLRRGVHTQWP